MTKKQFPVRRLLGVCAVAVLALGARAAANVGGAIFTTVVDGSVVNGNIYASKDAVYLNGGPENEHSVGLDPDGIYYFQVTDPSGAVELSTDDIRCRAVVVSGGRVVGVPAGDASGLGDPSCYHAIGTLNAANGTTPVQLAPYLDTPNSGGEYKAWLTPVAEYNTGACAPNHGSYGFCDSDSKTDNFKATSSSGVLPFSPPAPGYVTVCTFNDLNADGIQDSVEPLIPHWPITATGVDGGPVSAQTDDHGCTSFTYSDFADGSATQTVTLTEGTFGPDWTQTAPLNCGTLANCGVAGGVTTLTLSPGDDVQAPNFGNTNPYCREGCATNTLVVTKTAYPSVKRTFLWRISKAVDRSEVKTASTSATFNYTVTLTHDAGTDSDWLATGTIRASNPGGVAMAGVDVSDVVDNGGSCSVAGGIGLVIPAGSHQDLPYSCTYASAPPTGINTATAIWNGGSASGTATVDFSRAVVAGIDGTASVTDTLAGSLGTVTSHDQSLQTFSYSHSVNGVAGSCVSVNNTATFTTNTTTATGSDSRSVRLCVGADLIASTTASTAYTSGIQKSVDRIRVEQAGGSPTFTYTVAVTESAWTVSGTIHVVNPNDWQPITATLADVSSNGGSCALNSGSVISVPASSSVDLPYRCTYASAPTTANGTNTVAASWNPSEAFTANGAASGTAGFTFAPLTVVDTFDGTATTLGRVAAPAASTAYNYPHTVNNTTGGACRAYINTATIMETGQQSSQTVNVCNTATGALTIGFWQNKNGQGIISGGASIGGACASGVWLRQYAPFQDVAVNARCSAVATYVTNVIKAANASGASMNAMLKAQMLATSLDVYFSDAALGGNKIGAAGPLGAVKIDLTQVCTVLNGSGACSGSLSSVSGGFGGAASLTVTNMLLFQNGVANAGGTLWYGNAKATQQLAKNAFDAINNQAAYIAP